MNKLIILMKDWYLLIFLILIFAVFCYLDVQDNKSPIESSLGSKTTRIFSPDWGISADLINLGVIPVAVADHEEYKNWVGSPVIPKQSIDVGLRPFPNTELMASLSLDMVIDNDMYSTNRGLYNTGVKIKSVEYGRDIQKIDEVPKWSIFAGDMIKLGEFVGKKDIAKQYVNNKEQTIKQAGKNIKAKLGDNKKFLVVSLFDSSSLQVYNINHSVNLAMNIMDLELLPMGELDEWGTSSVAFHHILDIPDNTCLILIDPISPFVEHELKKSLIWQQSKFSKANACVYRIEPIWMYGSFSTLTGYALNLEKEIMNPRPNLLTITVNEGL